MKVKEIAKEVKQKKDKKRKFPCLLTWLGAYDDEQLVVLAHSKREAVILLNTDDMYFLNDKDYTDKSEWAMYEGEIRLYN